MGTRREELSTADLAGQPPTSAERSDVTARDDRTEAADPIEAADRTDDDVARDATSLLVLPVTTSQVNRP
jgi:hypothetical protein